MTTSKSSSIGLVGSLGEGRQAQDAGMDRQGAQPRAARFADALASARLRPTPATLRLLQVSLNILTRPDDALADLLDLPAMGRPAGAEPRS